MPNSYNFGMSAESGPVDELARRRAEPRRILVAGDWHGNEDWALSVIRRVPSLLAHEPRRLILQLGDFGIWPDQAGQHYLARVAALLAEVDAELWFIDGNHEDFPQLARLARGDHTPDGRVVVQPGCSTCPAATAGPGTGCAGWAAAAG